MTLDPESTRNSPTGTLPASSSEIDKPRLEQVLPVLMVRDVSKSIEFYSRLGFAEAFRDGPPVVGASMVRYDEPHGRARHRHPGRPPRGV